MRHRYPNIVNFIKVYMQEHPNAGKEGSPYEMVNGMEMAV